MALLIPMNGKTPRVDPTAFVAPNATLVGDVEVGPEASVWFGAVVRGDAGPIVIGARSNVQDNCVVHVFPGTSTIIEEGVTVGHGAVLEGCRIGRSAVIGMNAVVLIRADVGPRAVIAAGSVVTKPVPGGFLAAGNPAVVKKPIAGESLWWVENGAREYIEAGAHYRTVLEDGAGAHDRRGSARGDPVSEAPGRRRSDNVESGASADGRDADPAAARSAAPRGAAPGHAARRGAAR